MRLALRPLLALLVAALVIASAIACSGGDDDAASTATAAPATASAAATASPQATAPAATPWTTTSPQPMLPAVDIAYDGGTIVAELASTGEQRSKGLSGRASMDVDAGMLFDLGDTRIASFWMKDTLIPLDMIWITEDRVVAGIAADVPTEPGVPDQDLARWDSPVPVRYVLELNAGEAARRGIEAGDELRW